MTERYWARLLQNGVEMVRVVGPDRAAVEREIQHYALVYGQDGEVEIRRSPSLKRWPADTGETR